jgi:hypothetical protein
MTGAQIDRSGMSFYQYKAAGPVPDEAAWEIIHVKKSRKVGNLPGSVGPEGYRAKMGRMQHT